MLPLLLAAATPLTDCHWLRDGMMNSAIDKADQHAQCLHGDDVIELYFEPLASFDEFAKAEKQSEKNAGGYDKLEPITVGKLRGFASRNAQWTSKAVFVDDKIGVYVVGAPEEALVDDGLAWLLGADAAPFLAKRPKLATPIVCPAKVCKEKTVCAVDGILRGAMSCIIDGMYIPLVYLDDVASTKPLSDAAHAFLAANPLPEEKHTVVEKKIAGGARVEVVSKIDPASWYLLDGKGAFACGDNSMHPGACDRLEKWLASADGAPAIDALKASELAHDALPAGCTRPITPHSEERLTCASSSVFSSIGNHALPFMTPPTETDCDYGGSRFHCWCVGRDGNRQCSFYFNSVVVGWTWTTCATSNGDQAACDWWVRTLSIEAPR